MLAITLAASAAYQTLQDPFYLSSAYRLIGSPQPLRCI